MTKDEVNLLLNEELNRLDEFDNYHGITKDNLNKFLIDPYQVLVDPDDLETDERNMWVVLKLSEQSLVAIDPLDKSWSVLHPLQKGKFIKTIGEETLAEALDGM